MIERKELDLEQLTEEEKKFVEFINARMIGQEDAKKMLMNAFRAVNNSTRDGESPVYVALLVGDSRSGKTLTAELLSEYFHGRRDAHIRVNCDEYKDDHRLNKLFGSAPAYVGYRDPREEIPEGESDLSALLSAHNIKTSRKSSTKPVTVVLLDEFEKCEEPLEQALLAIFDCGKKSMGNNTVTDFTECIFLLTSNLGSKEVARESRRGSVGFDAPRQKNEVNRHEIIDNMMKTRFSPEFLNRIDETIVYHPLSDDQIAQVIDVELNRYIAEQIAALKESRFQLDVDESARQFIFQQTIAKGGGVANLKRVLKNQLKSLIGVAVSGNRVQAGQTLHVSHKAGSPRLTFSVSGEPVKAPPAPPPPPAVPAMFEWQRTSQSAEGWNWVDPCEIVESKELLRLAMSHLEKTGDFAKTETILGRSIDLLQDYAHSHQEHVAEVLHFYGEILSKQGRYADAIEAFNLAINNLRSVLLTGKVAVSQKLACIYVDKALAQEHIAKRYSNECESDLRISVLLGQLGLSQQ